MDDDADEPPPTVLLMINGWQATLMFGLVTLVLGVIVTAHPDDSLNVVAVLIGIAAIVSGIFHLIRTFDRAAQHRIWLGASGLAFVAIGLLLIRHLHLTVPLIALLVGLAWIIQGTAGLMSAFSGPREGAAWWGVFGSSASSPGSWSSRPPSRPSPCSRSWSGSGCSSSACLRSSARSSCSTAPRPPPRQTARRPPPLPPGPPPRPPNPTRHPHLPPSPPPPTPPVPAAANPTRPRRRQPHPSPPPPTPPVPAAANPTRPRRRQPQAPLSHLSSTPPTPHVTALPVGYAIDP